MISRLGKILFPCFHAFFNLPFLPCFMRLAVETFTLESLPHKTYHPVLHFEARRVNLKIEWVENVQTESKPQDL